jgi:hypothetical protein
VTRAAVLLVSGVFGALIVGCDRGPSAPISPSVNTSSSGIDALGAKGGKPTSQPATALFRCPGSACSSADGIQADGFDAPYASADGAQLDTVSEFSLRPVGARGIVLDFRNVLAPCASNCQKNFETLTVTSAQSTIFHTNVINPNTGDLADNGLLSIPVGATWPSRLKLGFNTPNASGTDVAWAVRYNPTDYPGSDLLHITRIDATSWDVEASPADRAMLVSFISRRQGNVNEGLYSMPFKVRVTVQ